MLFREFELLLSKEVSTFGPEEEESWFLFDFLTDKKKNALIEWCGVSGINGSGSFFLNFCSVM